MNTRQTTRLLTLILPLMMAVGCADDAQRSERETSSRPVQSAAVEAQTEVNTSGVAHAGWRILADIPDLVGQSTGIAEVTVTQITTPTYNTDDGLFPSDPEVAGSTLAFGEVAFNVDTFLAGDEVYTDTVGFVLDDPTLIAPGQTVPSEYVSVGTRGMLFVNPVSDAALAAPEPFRQRTIDLADTFTAGGFRHDVAVAVIFFRYDGNDAIDPQTGESMLITDLISEIEAAVGN